jgi:hypothetical protein
MCYILCMCVCGHALDMTTASDDPSSSSLCVMCVGAFLGGSQGGAGMPPPPGYAERSAPSAPKFFFWVVFAIFSDFLN